MMNRVNCGDGNAWLCQYGTDLSQRCNQGQRSFKNAVTYFKSLFQVFFNF